MLRGNQPVAQRHLFNGVDIFRLMEDRKNKLKIAFASVSNAQIDDLTMEINLANDYRLDVPILDETKKYAKTREAQVDVSRAPRRFITDRSRPFHVAGTEINIFVPFEGDPKIFDVKPTAFDMNPPYGDVVGQELHFIYRVADSSIDIEAENARTVGQIKKYLEWLRPSAEQLHVELRNLVRSLTAQRKQQVAAHAQVVGSLRMPIKRDETPAAKPALAPKERGRKGIRDRHERWDVFISHASEDKELIARPLADALISKGLEVWYDEFSLTIGDSLRQSIDRGLSRSRYGVVILSPRFFEKHWPQQELNGLATKEVGGKKVILPVWHEVDFEEVRQYSPTLADKYAVSSKLGLEYVVEKLLAAMV
jgi:TIR domain-containing protein